MSSSWRSTRISTSLESLDRKHNNTSSIVRFNARYTKDRITTLSDDSRQGPGTVAQGYAHKLPGQALRTTSGRHPTGMEFDINPQWVLFASYTDGSGMPPSTVGAKLLPSMNYSPEHFFSPHWRDFVAAFVKP